MGEDDQIGLVLHLARRALQHRIDADRRLGQDACQTRQHTGLVRHPQAQVVAGDHIRHGQHRDLADGVGLKSQVRDPVQGVGGVQTGDIDQIGDHRTGRGLAARALAVVQGGAHGIGLHHDRIHRPFDIGDQALGRHQTGVHPQLHAGAHALGDAQQLDAVAHLFGIGDVFGLQMGDALHIGLVKLHPNAKGNGRHQGGFVCSIYAFNVKSGVGLRVAQGLGLLQDGVKRQAFVAHLRQDEIGRAVDDAGNPLDAVGGQALAQGFDDGNATCHRRLKGHHHTLAVRGFKNLCSMHRQQGFVGGDHMLARLNRGHDQLAGNAIATNEFHHDIDVRVGHNSVRIVDHGDVGPHNFAGTRGVQVSHHGDFNAPSCTALNFLLVAQQHFKRAFAHGPNAQQAHLNRFHDA